MGYNAGHGRQTRQGQAVFLVDAVEALARRPDVATCFWFKYEDFPPPDGPAAQRWGLVTIPFANDPSVRDGAWYDLNAEIGVQPAWDAFAQAVKVYQHEPRR